MIDTDKWYSGTSGLVLPFPKKLFPPEFSHMSRLGYYASLFNSIEINSSFYRNPMASTVSRWATEVPGNFRFTFKLSKFISHAKGLEFNASDVEKFISIINAAGNQKACLLVQFPAGIKVEKFEQFQILLECIQAENHENLWKVAVEFRHPSWYCHNVYDLLEHYKASLVIHDMPGSVTPMSVATDVNFVYLRFHGPDGKYRGSYDDAFLRQYEDFIRKRIDEGKTVYCYFNNTMGDALNNLQTLNNMLES